MILIKILGNCCCFINNNNLKTLPELFNAIVHGTRTITFPRFSHTIIIVLQIRNTITVTRNPSSGRTIQSRRYFRVSYKMLITTTTSIRTNIICRPHWWYWYVNVKCVFVLHSNTNTYQRLHCCLREKRHCMIHLIQCFVYIQVWVQAFAPNIPSVLHLILHRVNVKKEIAIPIPET